MSPSGTTKPAWDLEKPIRIPGESWEEQRNAWQTLEMRLMALQQVIEDQQYAQVPPWTFKARPASTSTLTFRNQLSNTILPGVPILFVQNNLPYYARLKSIVAGVWTIQGAPFSTSYDLQYLGVGASELMVQWNLTIPTAYGFVGDLLLSSTGQILRWNLAKARLVAFSAIHETNATVSQPRVNVKVNGNLVSTESSNNGPSVSTSEVWNSDVAINTTNYVVDTGNTIDIRCTVAGNDGSAANLTVCLLFAYEKRAISDILQNLARIA